MNQLKSLLACAAISVASSHAVADDNVTITYDTLGLAHTSWLVPATVTIPGTYATDWDLPPITGPGYDLHHHTYMSAMGRVSGSGDIVATTALRAGGRLDAIATWSDTFENTSGMQQNYGFNIDIDQVNFQMGGWTADESTRDFQAGFSASVLVNGVSVWNTSQTFSMNGTGGTLTKTGYDIGTGTTTEDAPFTYAHNFRYELSPFVGVVDLGSFADGQTFDVSYVFSSFAYWNDPDGCSYECGYVGTNARDPFGLNGDPVVVLASNPVVTAVPEPQTYALLLAGLGLLGAIARRRNRA